MRNRRHICVVSLLFDTKPEGICTGRLVRALLSAGHRITLITSSKAKLGLSHPQLSTHVYSVTPKEPRSIFNAWAAARGEIANNFYVWSKRVAQHEWAKNEQPDMIYGRGWPHASLVAAYQLAKQSGLPLALHFSDPFPAPNEPALTPRFTRGLNRMVARAKVITFTNQETIDYQRQHLAIAAKMVAIPHVTLPQQCFLSDAPATHFYYIGSVGPTRPVDILLKGFKRLLNEVPEAKFYFVGSSASYLSPIIATLDLGDSVSVLPFTDDVSQAMIKAGTLVSVDVTVSNPIFTPTKILEYLSVNRNIFALTDRGSPVSMLLGRFPQTAVTCTEHTPEQVAQCLTQAAKLCPSRQDFAQRAAQMHEFQPDAIAETFNQLVLREMS